MGVIGHNEVPVSWKSGRHYQFYKQAGGVACESITIAASLLCNAILYLGGEVKKEYKPGSFGGTLLGHVTKTGETIYLFVINGDPEELGERQLYFHMGAHRPHPQEMREKRIFLTKVVKNAAREAKRLQFSVNGLKGASNEDDKVQGAEGVCDGGNGVQARERDLAPGEIEHKGHDRNGTDSGGAK